MLDPNTTSAPGGKVPCVIYAAKSTEDRHGSIQTQLEDCRRMAAREGWDARPEWEFTDEDESGWSGNRGEGRAGMERCAQALAAEHGSAVVVFQHTDRVSRGDGLKADHLVEIFLDLRRANVRLRSVQDDHNLTSVSAAANAGDRNAGDSDRKSLAVQDGYRRTAERGDCTWIIRGIKLDGYEALRTFDERGAAWYWRRSKTLTASTSSPSGLSWRSPVTPRRRSSWSSPREAL
jgi:hypothetical protein